MPIQDWLRGLAATAGQILLGLAVGWACYRVVRFTHKHPKP